MTKYRISQAVFTRQSREVEICADSKEEALRIYLSRDDECVTPEGYEWEDDPDYWEATEPQVTIETDYTKLRRLV